MALEDTLDDAATATGRQAGAETARDISRVPRAGTALPARRSMALRAAVALLLVGVTVAIFGRAYRYEFLIYDDNHYVTNNEQVKRGLSVETFLWAFRPTSLVAANWHPLTVISHMLDVTLFGLDPRGHHAMSVAFHALNVLLVFLVFERMTGRLWPSAMVAALFAWHPLHVESVAWVAERKDVLSTTFWLLTMAAYVHYARGPSWPRYTLVASLLTLGLLAKPMLVTLPAVLLLLDVWPLRRIELRRPSGTSASGASPPRRWPGQVARRLVEKVPLLAIVVVFCGTTLYAQRAASAVATLGQVPVTFRLENAVISYAAYLGQFIWPAKLAAIYPMSLGDVGLPRVIAAAAGLLLITVWVGLSISDWPYLTVGWLWYLGTLVPVIGLVQVGGQSRADRYTYIPLIGIFIMVAFGAAKLVERRPRWRPWVVGGCVVWLAALVPVTWHQVGLWRNQLLLFRHTLAVTGPNYLAHYHLGNGLLDRFVHLDENDPRRQAFLERGIAEYRRALKLSPNFNKLLYNYGCALEFNHDLAGATRCFGDAVRLGLDGPLQRLSLADVLRKRGRFEEARKQYLETLRLDPTLRDAMMGVAIASAKLGQVDRTMETYRTWLAGHPDDAGVMERLARIQASSPLPRFRDPRQALVLARRACELSRYEYPQMLGTLAAAHAENGNFTAAIDTASRALARRLAAEKKSPEVRQAIVELQRQIELYQRRRPLREDPAVRDWRTKFD